MQERKIIQQSKSFKDLDRTLAKLTKLKKSKLAGDVFEYLTKLYLEVSPLTGLLLQQLIDLLKRNSF